MDRVTFDHSHRCGGKLPDLHYYITMLSRQLSLTNEQGQKYKLNTILKGN